MRKQIERIDQMLSKETDPAKIDRLAAAFGRLSEIERQLAARPLPGSRRPAPEKPVQGRALAFLRPTPPEPIDSAQKRIEQE